MADKIPVSHIPPFGLRLQPELKALLEEAAEANNRSLNAEIASRLLDSFAKSGTDLAKIGMAALIDEVLRRYPPGMVEVRLGRLDEDEEEGEDRTSTYTKPAPAKKRIKKI